MTDSRIRPGQGWFKAGGRRARLAALIAVGTAASLAGVATQAATERPFTRNFNIEDCTFHDEGRNQFFSLVPGTVARFDGEEDGLASHLRITVMFQTRNIVVPGLGLVPTRVIEEKEWLDQKLVERSLNYFAICEPTNDVYYFGEDVDIYEDGEVTHEGAWLAGQDGAKPGIVMPGTFLLGSRYMQEFAPDVAMDRAEHTGSGLTVETGLGTLTKCVEITETTPLEPSDRSAKIYCPDVGLVKDEDLTLTTLEEPGGG